MAKKEAVADARLTGDGSLPTYLASAFADACPHRHGLPATSHGY